MKFGDKGLKVDYVKGLLGDANIPLCPFWHEREWAIKGAIYLYRGNIVKAKETAQPVKIEVGNEYYSDAGYVYHTIKEIKGNTIGGGGTPEAPIALQSVESPIALVNCGKNLWNSADMWSQLKAADATNINYVTFDGKDCISAYRPNATARALKFNYGFKTNTRYRIRLSMYHAGSSHGAYFQVWYTDGTYDEWYGQPTTNTALLNQWYYPTRAFNNYITDANKTIDYLAFTFGDAVTTYFDLDSFLITDAEIPNEPFEPYQGTTLSIPIKDTNGNALTLRRAGTAYDSVYKKNGKWYLRKAIKEQVLNGSEEWDFETTTATYYTIVEGVKWPASAASADADALTNLIATAHQTKSINQIYAGNNGVYSWYSEIGIRDAVTFAGFTEEDFKTWLSTHNITVAYELETPEIIELHEDTATALNRALEYRNLYITGTVPSIVEMETKKMGVTIKREELRYLVKANTNIYISNPNDLFEVISKYEFGKKYHAITSKYQSRSDSWNRLDHWYLGQYLRTIRELYDKDYMWLYNVWDGGTMDKALYLSNNTTTIGAPRQGFKTLTCGVSPSRTYTIYIDSPTGGVCAVLFQEKGNPLTREIIQKPQPWYRLSVSQPEKIHVDWKADSDTFSNIREYLTLAIQVPVDVKKIFIQEGDYTDAWKGKQIIGTYDPDKEIMLSKENIYTPSVAFDDRLIEYLTGHPIGSGQFSESIKHIQAKVSSDAFGEYAEKKGYSRYTKPYTTGVWDKDMQRYIRDVCSDIYNQNGEIVKEIEHLMEGIN